MEPKLEETIYVDFVTSSSDGAAVDADSTPTAEVFEDATDTTVAALTVTKRASKTGNYRVPIVCTTGNGFEENKSYNVVASATVGGVAAKAVVARFQVRPVLPDVNAAQVGGVDATPNTTLGTDVAAIKAKTDNLPAAPADASDVATAFGTVNTTLTTLTSYVDTEVTAIKARTDLIPDEPAAVGSEMRLDLTQDLTDVKTKTIGGALHGAYIGAFGKMVKDVAAKTLKLFGMGSQTTPIATFDLDSASDPTTRTPQ